MSNITLSEQEQIRRNSLDELRKLGINPYPAAEYRTNIFAKEIHDNFTPEKNNYTDVSIAGRLMSKRIMGNASFAELMDSTGRIQIYVRRDDVCPGEDKTLYNKVFKHLLDIGDIIGISALVYSISAFVISKLIAVGFRFKFLTYSFIVFLITEINILIISIIRYLFNFDINWSQMGLELVTKPVCNIILMFVIFPIISISSGMTREIELGLKYKNKI